MEALLLEQVLHTFQTTGAPLTGKRWERVKLIPAEYLHRLLDVGTKIESGNQDELYAAIDDVIQSYWNDLAAVASLVRG